ncbi:MAG: hypothetical protein K2L33_04015, partial [Muribaculaceae bacterium]|nr:hypothetical protein [Muribaculaceae bacterium]
MKIQPLLFAATAMSLTVASCTPATNNENNQSLMEISKQELATALEERDQLLSLVRDVAAGIEQIKQLEGLMDRQVAGPNESARQHTRIMADIAKVRGNIEQRKAQLAALEHNLQESTINNKELTETINALRLQIDSQLEEIESLKRQLTSANEHIGTLSYTVDSLNLTVAAIADERDSARSASVRLDKELNSCYYIVASKSELKKLNIIETGFLRNTKVMKREFDKSSFIPADKRELMSL